MEEELNRLKEGIQRKGNNGKVEEEVATGKLKRSFLK